SLHLRMRAGRRLLRRPSASPRPALSLRAKRSNLTSLAHACGAEIASSAFGLLAMTTPCACPLAPRPPSPPPLHPHPPPTPHAPPPPPRRPAEVPARARARRPAPHDPAGEEREDAVPGVDLRRRGVAPAEAERRHAPLQLAEHEARLVAQARRRDVAPPHD